MMHSNQPYQKTDESEFQYQWGRAMKAVGFGMVQGAAQEAALTVAGTGQAFGKQLFNADNRASKFVRDELLYNKGSFGDHFLARGMSEENRVRRALSKIPDHGVKTPIGRIVNYGSAIGFGLLAGFIQDQSR
ncbi:hypothetical protein GZH47_32810 (plasmid) [Paenibacillus rhizovicinus]|uniref:Uncharacterized protein n=1 Tax=Paenibacillus rhizovicinus TaxID=2704463 RepID=A0A6C0PBC4_9BACL|nr:hypothetical protein [Paenibacillus rhizovicinus]QHW35681.1 hypothetical protein GZH47_32810 [Paenibacillus rhizovicinus]